MSQIKFIREVGDHETLVAPPGLPEQVHVFSADEVDAVDAALAAGRPLLLRGEPGIGKSQLARAVAKRLKRSFIPFVVDGRTESRDLLWSFDAVKRLADAQLAAPLGWDSATAEAKLGIQNYLRPVPLWWAFNWPDAAEQGMRVKSPEPPQPDGGDWRNGAVVLIDEIDKAETDVPNGLLEALGTGQFTPLGRSHPVVAAPPPALIIITTNEERALPDAFIRRCLVLYMALPKLPAQRPRFIDRLVSRGEAHFGTVVAPEVLKAAADQLADDRERAQNRQLRPLPGQAEYLDLVRALHALTPNDPKKQKRIIGKLARFTFGKSEEPDEPV